MHFNFPQVNNGVRCDHNALGKLLPNIYRGFILLAVTARNLTRFTPQFFLYPGLPKEILLQKAKRLV